MLDDAQEIGTGTHGWIERDHVVIRKAQGLAESLGQQMVDEADLRVDHLHRRVVSPRILAQIGVVGGQKVLVEVQPGVLGPHKGDGRHGGDDA
jgi:hypothetical protein